MSAFRFLLLEANLLDAQVVQATLMEGGINCELLRVETRADFIRTLETEEIDLILADYALSSFDGIAALTIARRLCPEMPFIFISGSLGEELAIEAIKQGATDYVLKQRLGRLVTSVERALPEVPELDKDTIRLLGIVGKRVRGKGGSPLGIRGKGKGIIKNLFPLTFPLFPQECKSNFCKRSIDRKAEAAAESDLKDTQLLHELSARLVTEGDIQTLYQEIIAAAITITRADAGTVQILDETAQDLLLLAAQGFEQNLTEHFHCVNTSSNTFCGITLATGKRTFVDFNVPESEDPDGSMRLHLEAGYLLAQSTPLITRSGKAIGMVSTHWRKHHRPSDRELRFLDLLARQAADLIEQRQAQVALRSSEIERVREQAAREQERQRAETLAELDRAKTLFFSNVSHEFRTPLTLSLAPVQDALSDLVNPLPQAQRERLKLAHRNSLRLLKLVNILLDFSCIEADRLKANYQPTDLSTYTAELASVFRSAIENANLELVIDCPPLPNPIYVDREMWEKIVLNLLSNALKFTFEGIISVSLKPKANTVELMVSDTGVGISASELPHLFKRFYQVKGTKGRSYEGSGIGLSLVQELVKRHGGAIAVTSTVYQGTTFTVTIATGIAHLPADQICVASTLPSTAVTANAFVEQALRWLAEESREFQSSEVQAQSSKRARILVVDDNADMRGYLRRLLNQYYEVETVNNGLAALSAIRRGGSAIYDLVLADVIMPRMDGFELLRSLRADPNTQTMPIILLSALAGEESRMEGLETGADDYLIKPFSARELLTRVNVNLQLAQMRREVVYREQVMQAVQTLNDRLEQQVKARTAQLEAINQELEAFSSLISHDLRTPLRYISSFAERLQGKLNTSLVDTSSLHLNIIRQSALQAEKMVDDLLEFSHLGKTEMHSQTVIISQLVEQVREQLQPELVGRSLHWKIEPLVVVKGDPALLLLVLQNLLSNAIKYSRKNTEAIITIGSIEQEQEVIFFIKDNGAGFDMKYYD